jgi:hypothetical protein
MKHTVVLVIHILIGNLEVDNPHFGVLGISAHHINRIEVVVWIQTRFISWVKEAHG